MTQADIERAMQACYEEGGRPDTVVIHPSLVPLVLKIERLYWYQHKIIIHDLPNEVLHGEVKGYN